MCSTDKLPCPKCDGLIHENKCVRCNTVFKNAEMHKIWMKEFKGVYDIDEDDKK